jgi:hypothetical protein
MSPAFVVATMSAAPADVVPTAQQYLAVEQDTPVRGPVSFGSD